MISRRTPSALVAALVVASVTLDAGAHVSLDYPKSRYYVNNLADQNKLKNGPCGASNDSRTTNTSLVTTLKPGDKVTVRWRETVQHPGFFRIAFDSDGQNFTLPGSATNGDGVTILADKIADKSGANNLEYTYEVTLPNIECTKCTLQLIQVMTTSPPPYEEGPGKDLYFNCADLILQASSGSGSGGSGAGGANAGGAPNAGNGAGLGGSGGRAGSSSTGGNSSGGTGMGGFGMGGASQGGTAQGGSSPGGASGGQASAGVSSAQGGIAANGGSIALGGAPAQGGTTAGSGMNGGGGTSSGGALSTSMPPDENAGCSCRVGAARDVRGAFAFAGLLLASLGRGRRRQLPKRRPASR